MARTRSRRSRRNGRKPDHSISGLIWIGALLLIVGAIAATYLTLKRQMNDDATDDAGCLTNRETPEAALFMVDTTDRLTPANAEHVVTAIHDLVNQLPRYSRIIIVPFGDDTAAPQHPIFSRCLPGRGNEAKATESARFVAEAYKSFEDTVAKLGETLENQPDAQSSPISDQIVRAASDSVLHWKGQNRTLVVFSDGLESSIYWTKELQLRDPPPHILEGVNVEYHEIGNERSKQMQTHELREKWRTWFDKGGASVRMTAPGYPS